VTAYDGQMTSAMRVLLLKLSLEVNPDCLARLCEAPVTSVVTLVRLGASGRTFFAGDMEATEQRLQVGCNTLHCDHRHHHHHHHHHHWWTRRQGGHRDQSCLVLWVVLPLRPLLCEWWLPGREKRGCAA
jgi:hypothetical protein